MRHLTNISRVLVFSTACIFVNSLAAAKGLDSLKPGDEENAAVPSTEKPGTPNSPATGDAKPAVSAPTGVSSAGAPAPAPIPAGAPAGAAPGTPAVAVAKVIEPSASSKAISDKLHMATSLGFIKVTGASKGDWDSTGAVDLLIGWRFVGGAGKNYNLDVNLRYLPIEVSADVEDHIYRGVIEGYHLGPALGYHLSDTLDVLASLEVGYLLVYLESLDQNELRKDAASNGIEFTVGTGLDWLFGNKKIKFGPRFYAGFGKFQTMQFAAAATVLF